MSKLMRVEHGLEIGDDTLVLFSSSDPSTGGGLAAPKCSICLVKDGSNSKLFMKDGPGDTDWEEMVREDQVGSDTYYSNSSTTTVDWSNGAVQRLTARSGSVTLSFSNPESSRSYTLVVEASGADITFVFPVGHSTDNGEGTDTITNGKIKAYVVHYINNAYFWNIGAELDNVV